MSTKYNGWTNYETWAVNLWLTNDEGSDSYWRERAQDCYGDAEHDGVLDRDEVARIALADALRDEIEEGNPLDGDAGLYLDLLTAAIGEVNWYEIAGAFMDSVEKDEPEEVEAE